MTPDLLPGIATETLDCFAGHSWTRPHSRGGKPTACPEHIRYLNEPISGRLRVPKRLLDLWAETAVVDEPPVYVKRWTKVWERVVRILAAKASTFAAVDMDLVEEYVRHQRLAELHRSYAEYEPYSTSTYGSIKAHPGWHQAQVEELQAKKVAIELGLVPDPKAKDTGGSGDDLGGYEIYDDQLGPDGNPL